MHSEIVERVLTDTLPSKPTDRVCWYPPIDFLPQPLVVLRVAEHVVEERREHRRSCVRAGDHRERAVSDDIAH